jgi:hypothetical protein
MKQALVIVAMIALPMSGCQSHQDGAVMPEEPGIRSRTITRAELPKEFDSSRTYHLRSPSQRPESALVSLLHAGFAVTRAWQALDNWCADPVGPTFTVELQVDKATIQEHGLERGAGRLLCASMLTEYSVTRAGSSQPVEADGAREVRGRRMAAFARRSLAGASGGPHASSVVTGDAASFHVSYCGTRRGTRGGVSRAGRSRSRQGPVAGLATVGPHPPGA